MTKEPKKLLTDRGLKSPKSRRPAAPGKRRLEHDANVPGLAVRVTDKGRRTYVLIRRYPGSKNPAPRALGEVGAITLDQARAKARHWLDLIRRGIDPSAEEEQARLAALRKQENSFIAVAEEYLRRAVTGRQRKAKVVERELRREFIARWNSRPITSITRHDVLAVIDAAVDRGATYQAHNLLGHIRRLFNWAISRGLYGLEHSPCDRMKPKDVIGKKVLRKRILKDPEILALWYASEKLGCPYGPIYRLLLLTGQRKSEVAGARWREFDLEKRLWTIPAERMKMESAHVVPLTDDAIAILKSLPTFKKPDYLFSTTFGRTSVNGFSKNKARLDKAMLAELRAVNPDAELPAFVVHDIRRSVRTHLAALPIAPLVAERVIAHAKQGIDRTYNLYEYLPEKTHALELWAARLRGIVAPAADNVVSIARVS
jgi:integrase